MLVGMRLHGMSLSGHSHRARLLLGLLGVPFTWVEVDLAHKEHRSPAFLARNPFGLVPVLEDGDVTVFDSNAILVYLAQKYDAARTWLPTDAADAAHVQSWLGAAAGPLLQGPAWARMHDLFGLRIDHARACDVARELFGILEAELGARPFLVGSGPTIADLALYSYTAHAPEGRVSLEAFPAVRAWLGRIEALPGFVPMARS